MSQSVSDQAGYIYNACYDEICATPNGDDQWDITDGPEGDVIATVSRDVITYLDNNFDMPVTVEA